ncbi:2,4'-dihydroxyacetophenone dioxygenase family protein [Actinomycetospora straminea]|uniref:ChrR-like cupin domain-containing protein n=1 Tax=Actinomycetospora straminea TaxID=663607 RepID=A0ABP9EKD7_9PSEU|nr:2,4'-dihydroxyacetophenone dioxygenase family protein [Actinomycetospora straminea]MDD7933841.1 2,4'-dihydroxyacetophenone dioxygenase family protein [Actinomycetospora straminea]
MTTTAPTSTSLDPAHFGGGSRHWHPFTPYSEDVELKIFTADLARNETVVLLRAKAGAHLGVHDHFGRVLAYSISGKWSYAEHDWEATPGDFVYEVANSRHTLVADPAEDIVLFIYVEGPIHFLDGDGTVVGVETAKSFAERYLQFCRDHGYPEPDLFPF